MPFQRLRHFDECTLLPTYCFFSTRMVMPLDLLPEVTWGTVLSRELFKVDPNNSGSRETPRSEEDSLRASGTW